MPKPSLFDSPKQKRKKKKRKKRKVDYTELLTPPIIPIIQCAHTKKAQDASSCSQCMLVQPSVVHKPVTKDWWAEGDDDIVVDIDVDKISINLDDE